MTYDGVFIDSSYYCALVNSEDSLHKKSLKYINSLENSYTSNFILLESYTVISQKAGKTTAVKFGEKMQSQSNTSILLVTPNVEHLSWEIFKSINNKNLSYVDCSILALLQINKINTLLSFDSHFKPFEKQFNFNVLQ